MSSRTEVTTLCDVHLAAGVELPEARTWRVGVEPPDEVMQTYEVDLCGEHEADGFNGALATLAAIVQHGRQVLDADKADLPWRCNVCGRQFRSAQGLAMHRRSHREPSREPSPEPSEPAASDASTGRKTRRKRST